LTKHPKSVYIIHTRLYVCLDIKMRKTKKDTEISRQKIIDASRRIFCEKGYTATKLEDIGKAVGMTRGVVYWHFKNKAELFQYLVENAIASMDKLVDEVLATKLPIVEKLRCLFLRSQENHEVVLLRSIVPEEKVARRLKKYVDEKGNKIMAKIVRAFNEAKARGEIQADTDTKSVLGLLAIFMSGLDSSKRSTMSIESSIDNIEGMTNIIFKGISSFQKK
jgi:AcrR family transcriptional regulator